MSDFRVYPETVVSTMSFIRINGIFQPSYIRIKINTRRQVLY